MTENRGGLSCTTRSAGADGNAGLARAYLLTYRGPNDGSPADGGVTAPIDVAMATRVSPELLAAHYRLGHRRSTGETLVAIYAADDPGRFGPALQIVTDHSALLMDSVMVLLHRIGVAYTAIMSPEFRVRRDAAGEVVAMGPAGDPSAPADGVDETWIHVQLATMGDGKAVAEAAAVLPHALTDTRAVQLDTPAMNAALVGLANALDADHNGRFPGYDRRDVAALLRWLADGHFVLLGYQQCTVENGQAQVDPATRLGVAKLRSDVLPPLAGDDELLAVAQATMPSYLRYGAYPYIVWCARARDRTGPRASTASSASSR